MQPISFVRRAATLALVLGAAACDGNTAPEPAPQPATMVALTATTQPVVIGSTVPIAPAVRVADSRGRAVVGMPVTFAAGTGGGSVNASAVTDSGGVAVAANWRVDHVAQEYVVTASVPGLTPVVFRALAEGSTPVKMEKAGGDGQVSAVGTVLRDSLGVRVVDSFGNGVPRQLVDFTASGGVLSATRVPTDARGYARVHLSLPLTSTTIYASAVMAGMPTQFFTITVTAGPPTTLSKVWGDGQAARSGRPVHVLPMVRVTDLNGNPVEGQQVVFTPAAGSGNVTGATATTNGLGYAGVGSWVLGNVGPNYLTATVAGVSPVTFTATALEPCRTYSYTLFTTVTGVLDQGATCNTAGYRNAELYAFTVATEQCIDFRMNGGFDPYLYLLDSQGNVLAQDDDSGEGLNSWIRRRVPAGSYMLGAAAFSGGSGAFELSSAPVPEGETCWTFVSASRAEPEKKN